MEYRIPDLGSEQGYLHGKSKRSTAVTLFLMTSMAVLSGTWIWGGSGLKAQVLPVSAQQDTIQALDTAGTGTEAASTQKGFPVVYKDTIAWLYGSLGPYTAEERARDAGVRIKERVKSRQFKEDSLYLVEHERYHEIRYGNGTMLALTIEDARGAGLSITEASRAAIKKLDYVLASQKRKGSLKDFFTTAGLIVLILTLLYFTIKGFRALVRKLQDKLQAHQGSFFRKLKIGSYELLSVEREVWLANRGLEIIRWAGYILIIYLAASAVFSVIPGTRGFAAKLMGYFLTPFKVMGSGIIGFIPNLITIAVILFITQMVLRIVKIFANEIENEKLVIGGFYPDWARPTYNIVRFLVYVFAFVAIFPYLPGSQSPIFQGVSVFLGLLISLGSTSAVANIVAGLVLTYMRPFQVGDRVRIGEVEGQIIEKNMLLTRVRTIRNEEITLPNNAILSGHTINYSARAQKEGTIITSEVTIGYDVPWRQVQELLQKAAAQTQGVLDQPKPYVLQTALNDFYVHYQIHAYIKEPLKMPFIVSELNSAIQDQFAAAGVEIMSPHYRADRDGNASTIPKK